MEVAGSTVGKQRWCETQDADWIIEVSYLLLALHILFLVLYLLLEHMYTAGPGKTRLVSDMSRLGFLCAVMIAFSTNVIPIFYF